MSARAQECMRESFLEDEERLLPPSGSTVYVLMDGGRIRMRENSAWREPCCALMMWADEQGQWVKHGLSDPLRKEEVLEVLDRWLEGLRRANPSQEVVIIVDGAEWIWKWASKYPWALKNWITIT